VSAQYTELIGPLYGTINGFPAVVIGTTFLHTEGKSPDFRWMYIDDDGHTKTAKMEDLVVDLRFKDGSWHDVSPTVIPPGAFDEDE